MTFHRMHFIFHYFCYYLAWVLGLGYVVAGKGISATAIVLVITAAQVAWQFCVEKRTSGLLAIIFILTLAGFLVDSLFMALGLIDFTNNPWMHTWSPPWLISLWISFAVSYYAVMQWLSGRKWLLGLLSLFAFPAVYYAGIKLGVGTLPMGKAYLLAYGVVWAALLPFCDYIYRRLMA